MHKILIVLTLILSLGCSRNSEHIEPKLTIPVSTRTIERIPDSFASFDSEEAQTDWGKESIIGSHLAKDMDMYRAITAFKRAKILSQIQNIDRRLEIDYKLILCYFLSRKYDDVIELFEKSDLQYTNPSFPAYRSLLTILYESYLNRQEDKKAQTIKGLIDNNSLSYGNRLSMYTTLKEVDLPKLQDLCHQMHEDPEETPKNMPTMASTCTNLEKFIDTYHLHKKSRRTAEILSALLPGSGYLYVGQVKSATTSFILNGLFIAASWRLFEKGHTAWGIITTGFELGWYIGGIQGSSLAAKKYNETLYETLGRETMQQTKIHPVLMIEYGF